MSEVRGPNLVRLGRRLRLAFIGGGAGSGIGATHRYAARLDGKYDIVGGAFDVDEQRGRAFATELLVDPQRVYADVDSLIGGERAREDRADVVAVLTPNHTHFAIARALARAGFDILCEKPMATTADDARLLVEEVERSGVLLAVNYGYSGYPVIRQARDMCARGDFGRINLIQIEWAFGLPHTMKEEIGGHWRTKPGLVGRGAVLAQIATHAVHMASYVTGLSLEAVSADLATFVPGRELEDNAQISLRFSQEARGGLWASYVAAGAWHGFKIKIFGDRGGFEWAQEEPNNLLVHTLGGERRILTRAGVGATDAALAASRIAAGHPEGFIEAIANLYSDFAECVAARIVGGTTEVSFPDHRDGAFGVRFIDAAVDSSLADGAWTPI